jgi:hypothetical protein
LRQSRPGAGRQLYPSAFRAASNAVSLRRKPGLLLTTVTSSELSKIRLAARRRLFPLAQRERMQRQRRESSETPSWNTSWDEGRSCRFKWSTAGSNLRPLEPRNITVLAWASSSPRWPEATAVSDGTVRCAFASRRLLSEAYRVRDSDVVLPGCRGARLMFFGRIITHIQTTSAPIVSIQVHSRVCARIWPYARNQWQI